MSSLEPTLSIIERLGRALDRGHLPAGGPAEAAERLIERLERPARVAILGMQGAGKTAVLNLLAGETVVPEDLALPTVLVQRGGEARMICTLADGSSEVIDGTDLADTVELQPALVTLECDLPALSVISLLEVAAGPSEQDQRRAMAWAGKRADIVVWCSTAFLPREQMLWEALPDQTKDNGFLLVTKTDLIGSQDAVAGVVKRIEARAGQEFRRVLPISVLEAGRALLPDGTVDREQFRDSGASAVISAIKSRVEMAHKADAATAEALLLRHARPPQRTQRRVADPVPVLPAGPVAVPDALPEIAPPTPAAPVRAETRPLLRRVLSAPPSFSPPVYVPPSLPRSTLDRIAAVDPSPTEAAEARPEMRQVPRPPRQTPLILVPKGDSEAMRPRTRVTARPLPPAATMREMLSPADRAIVEAAVAVIADSAARMVDSVAGMKAVPVEEILDLSHATTDDVAAILGKAAARPVRRIATDLGEIQDLVLLMKLEKGPAPADDAITMLLQIRRDLETLMAA
ncbi:hypothetical protein [Tabrizicola sp. BL-A-41-H6]|uniref:hypothetical protein n=1 Tax=Tabrizicola sp. BL-A-41-H6 TaxID=3421107 RepID=UPI003D665BF7